MIGTAFSMAIRLELAAPGVQYLQADHQLYNGAPSNLISRWLSAIWIGAQPFLPVSPPTWVYLAQMQDWCKASDLPSRGQLCRDNSMSEKGSERMSSSYVPYGEDDEPLQPVMQVRAPGDNISLVTEQEFYVGAPVQYPSTSRATSSGLKIGGHLSGTMGGLLKNSGTPDSGNTWGVGGSAVGPWIQGRTIHHSSTLLSRKGSKGARLLSSRETIPTGVVKLEKLIKDNLADRGMVNEHVIGIVADIDVLKMAYTKIKSEPGNMTPGVDSETLDGISQKWFERTSKEIMTGAFQFKPARRVEIPKAKGGTLGVPSPRDKIVQEAMRMVIEAIYEPIFSIHSHGFRPKRGCHTALKEIKNTFTAVNWFVEGDISKCFDSFDHKLLICAVKKRITDRAFIDLLHKALRAGYIFQEKYSELGTPQGSVISPILCNVLMHEFDKWMEIQMEKFNIGKRRKLDPEYRRLTKKGLLREAHLTGIQSRMAKVPDYKRMRYVRYADDFLIGVLGSKEDCLQIREKVAKYLLEELKLDLNLEKTKITHATTETPLFLGTQIRITPHEKKPYRKVVRGDQEYLMLSNTAVQLIAPVGRLIDRLTDRGLCRREGDPTRWTKMVQFDSAHIVKLMWQMWNGIATYYSFANNYRDLGRVHYILKYSCMLTLVSKFKLGTLKKGFKKFGKNIEIKDKDGKILTSFPDVPFKAPKKFHITCEDPIKRLDRMSRAFFRTSQIMSSECLICGAKENLEMHHVKHIRKATEMIGKDYWTRVMSTNRKQIPVCRTCHNQIHKGEYDKIALKELSP